MSSSDCARSHIAATAVLAAVVEAGLRDDGVFLRRLVAAPDLLRRHAAAMAASPIARDQILALALTAAAEDLERRRPPRTRGLGALVEGGEVTEDARLEVRRQVFRHGAPPAAESRRVVEDLERRYQPECATPRALSRRLRDDARLHELFWDDPRLACDGRTRLVMMSSVPALLARAAALDPRPLAAAGGGA